LELLQVLTLFKGIVAACRRRKGKEGEGRARKGKEGEGRGRKGKEGEETHLTA
jgi:hypothetical protein